MREGALVLSIALCIWSIAYVVLLKALWTRPVDRTFPTTIFFVQAVLLLVTLFSALPFNSDQYAYVGYSELVHLGANPYAPPLKTEPLPSQLRAIATVWSIDEGDVDARKRIIIRSRYGPLWTSLSAIVLYPFGRLSIETKAYALRVFAALATIACSFLLWFALRGSKHGTSAIAAFALSPVIVLQTANGAHNDIFALLFVLVTIVSIARERYVQAAIALAASLAVKVTFAPFVAAFVVLVAIRKGAARAASTLAVMAIVIVALALPYGIRRSLIQPLEDVHRFNMPYLAVIAARALHHVPGAHVSASLLATLYTTAVAACALAIAFFALRQRRVPALEAVTLLSIFCAAHFEPWYAIVLVPLLLVPAIWAVPLFAGVSLASQVFTLNEFAFSYGHLPLVRFVFLAIFGTLVIALYVVGRDGLFKPANALPIAAD